MLIYHLYDDYQGFFSDLSPILREYHSALRDFREDVGQSQPTIQLITGLEDLGLQLTELKRFFQISAQLIDQILKPSFEYRGIHQLVRGSDPTALLFQSLKSRIKDHCVAKVRRLINEKEALDRIVPASYLP